MAEDKIPQNILDAGQPRLPDDPEGAQSQPPEQSRDGKPVDSAPNHKTTPVFVYLAVLFAAAFLMLLLAYFIQQRNSENAIDNLRSSMTATREELMEQNRQLQEARDGLELKVEELNGTLAQMQEENAGLKAALEAAQDGRDPITGEWKNRADVLTCLAVLEQAIREENYEAAAEEARRLCQGDWNLDISPDGGGHFDPSKRLAELIALLEEQGALEEGELSIP